MNPLLTPFNTPHQTPPYHLLKVEHFMPAFLEAMAEGRTDIEKIVNNPKQPTFENTIVALERAGGLLNKITPILFHLNAAETNDDLQKTVRDVSPLLTEYGNDISLNLPLFEKVKNIWEQREQLNLDKQDEMLLEKTYKSFSRNGANLNETDKSKLRNLDQQLSELSITFNENNLAETNEYALKIRDENNLAGLPDFAIEAAKNTAQKQNFEGWVFTLHAPSYGPFLQYANNRELRKELWMAYNKKGFNADKYDNQTIILQIVKLRHQKAVLLGYNTWAEYVLEERMAETPEKVMNFEQDVLHFAKPAAQKELAELTFSAKQNGFEENVLQRWDASYYAEKLKKEKFSINDEILKPYFKLENVLDGLFILANKLFGLTFKENPAIPVWHDEVKAYEIFDEQNQLLSIWYGDYFPREGKRAGAWNTTTQSQYFEGTTDVRPQVVNVCNFSRPTDTKPSLLTFREVETLYHEFGHALHSMLSHVKYETISGTSVSWDFVELPSQFMENFCLEPEVLNLFAKHFETNELIPTDYIQKLKAASNFMAGLFTARQINLGLTDMAWHSGEPTDESIAEVELRIAQETDLYPVVEGTAISTSFAHIFAGGYSAGYYSYMWSEVLDADAFEAFKEKGIFDKTTADSFKNNILAMGGTEKPMVLYKKFRGREPRPEAMLRRKGLIK